MAIKTINIEGVDYQLGGASGGAGGIFPTLIVQNDRRMYIRCQEGQIQETDTLQFARLIASNGNKQQRQQNGSYPVRRHGWIVPAAWQLAEMGISFKLVFSETKDGYDYWHVVTEDDNEIAYVAEDFYINMIGGGEDTYVDLDKKCGLAVMRDGVQISDYIHFRVIWNSNRDLCTPTYW